MEKIVLVGSIAAGIILTILIIFFVVKFFKLFPNPDTETPSTVETTITPTVSPTLETVETIVMPSVVGLTLQDAEDTLNAKSDKFEITYKEESSDTVEKGMVIEQYPAKDAEVETDAEVTLYVSTGPEAVEIPNVYDSSDSQAVTILTEAGFEVKHEYAYSDEIDEGRVISTTPARGTSAYPGDTVTVVISNGPENTDVTVPDIIGLTQKKAIKALEDVGLTSGEVTTAYSDTYSKGQVIYQNYDSGATIAKGTAVDFTVSLGPDTSDTGTQSYTGSVTIDENPFDYSGDSAMVEIELIQDGNITTLKKEKMTYDSFPLTISNITSTSGSTGTVQMFIGREVDEYEDGVVTEDGVLIKYEQYETSWTVSFTPVGD